MLSKRKTIEELEEMTPDALGLLLVSLVYEYVDPMSDIKRDIQYLKDILNCGANLEVRFPVTSDTSIHLASGGDYPKITQLLIEAGADLEAKDNNYWTPLHQAAFMGRPKNVKVLIEAGVDLEQKTQPSYRTPLHFAIKFYNYDALKILIYGGADIEAKDVLNQTPLHYAVGFNTDSHMVKFLIENGADVNARDNSGQTPWDMADPDIRIKIPKLNPKYNG